MDLFVEMFMWYLMTAYLTAYLQILAKISRSLILWEGRVRTQKPFAAERSWTNWRTEIFQKLKCMCCCVKLIKQSETIPFCCTRDFSSCRLLELARKWESKEIAEWEIFLQVNFFLQWLASLDCRVCKGGSWFASYREGSCFLSTLWNHLKGIFKNLRVVFSSEDLMIAAEELFVELQCVLYALVS